MQLSIPNRRRKKANEDFDSEDQECEKVEQTSAWYSVIAGWIILANMEHSENEVWLKVEMVLTLNFFSKVFRILKSLSYNRTESANLRCSLV